MERAGGSSFGERDRIRLEELRLATRNHGLPLEVLRAPLTPIGLHYLLIHYDIPLVDAGDWALEVTGHVRRPRSFTLEELRRRPRVSVPVTMECAGNGRALLDPRPLSQPWLLEAVGTAQWSGLPLRSILDEVDVDDDAVEVVFTGLDRGTEGGVEQCYERALPLAEARRPEVLLADQMNGHPLLPQHGAPLRLVVPGWYGMANVKWLSRITLVAEPFGGYQQDRAYRFRSSPEDVGTPMSRIRPRALMVPPGIPDFFTRTRVLGTGPCTLEGRAWSGWGAITSVEVSVDGGLTWMEARLEPSDLGPWAWRRWTVEWRPSAPGDYVLCCRARDSAGNAQEDGHAWNVGGYANPGPQRVPTTVRA